MWKYLCDYETDLYHFNEILEGPGPVRRVCNGTDNRISYSVDRSGEFEEIHRSNVPTWVNHWRYNWDGDVVLPEPAETVYVRYTANTGLNTIRACLHLVSEVPSYDRLRIVHVYRLGGEVVEKERLVVAPADYRLDCQSEPENVYLKIEAPHLEKSGESVRSE